MPKKKIDYELIIKLYTIDKLSQVEIGKICNCSQNYVSKILLKNNIKTRRNELDNLIGRKFHKLKPIKHLGYRNTNNKATLWLCKCECGKTTKADTYSLKHGKHQSCGKCKQHHKITGTYWKDLVWQGTRRGLEFKITKEEIWKLYQKQNGLCKYSGLPIDFATTSYGHRHGESTASLDRIDSSKGYVGGNIQWVHKDINIMKQEYKEEYFIKLCKLVAKRN